MEVVAFDADKARLLDGRRRWGRRPAVRDRGLRRPGPAPRRLRVVRPDAGQMVPAAERADGARGALRGRRRRPVDRDDGRHQRHPAAARRGRGIRHRREEVDAEGPDEGQATWTVVGGQG